MARIQPNPGVSVMRINSWLGVNEHPDGDTELRPGEAAEMINFRITKDGNLQIRPGMRTVHYARAWPGPIRGVWHGRVKGAAVTVFAAGGRIWTFDFSTAEATEITAETVTDGATTFFGFARKLYIMTGHEYLEWDGDGPVRQVEGYRPLVSLSRHPSGGGSELEQINKLTGKRRVRYSPTDEIRVYQLPERDIKSVDYVRDLAAGADIDSDRFTADLVNGIITFNFTPANGINTIEIGYTAGTDFRREVEAKRFAEFFNGGADNRVFIYGDESNKALYTGLDTAGNPRADYFPDLNVLDVGTANTPITAMIRHQDRLAVFKTDSAYTVQHGVITLEDGRAIPAFYVSTVNRSIGNAAPGQAELVQNNPRTLFNSAVYEWSHQAIQTLTQDSRQSRVVSRRVHATLSAMNLKNAVTFDDNERQEFYIIEDGVAVVNNYMTDTWFIYRDFDISHLFTVDGGLYGTTRDGDIVRISRAHTSDNGRAIHARWVSGSIAFNRDWQRKFVSRLFVTMKPEARSFIRAGIRTNRSQRIMRTISQGLITFKDANFRHWSFGANRQPQTRRLRIRANKLTYLQLEFESNSDWNTATILAASMRVMYSREAR
ncbi:MAG: hypothetical protein FWC96_07470 [Oscillospiraceae bacterium]|nr:hypothetical protein [Oscillospiraceae bacterium]